MYKVWNGSRTVKKVVKADSFQDLKTEGKSILKLSDVSSVVLNSDGTEIEDDGALKTFANEVFLLLSPNETWTCDFKCPTDITVIGITEGTVQSLHAVGYQEVDTQQLEELHVGYQNIQKQHVHGPSGVIGEQFLDAKIEATQKYFVETHSYSKIEEKLKNHGHITLCGASGEGKTTISLILALSYRERGYKVVFVEDLEVFSLHKSIDSTSMVFLIIDDIFGKKKKSQDITKIGPFFRNLETLLESREPPIAIVFSSKTYNLKAAISQLQCETIFFREETVVDLTEDVAFHISQEEMETIFKHHCTIKGVDKCPENIKGIFKCRSGLFGFPLTCKLFFDTLAPGISASEFFERPLPYLKIELGELLRRNDDTTGVLVLMFLCQDGQLHLEKLHIPNEDPHFEKMVDTIRVFDDSIEATRTGMYNEAKNLRGIFFAGGDSLSFAHPSIYEACAREIFELNPNFGIDYCSDNFVCKWLKPDIDSTEFETFHAITVSENYHDKLEKRLANVSDPSMIGACSTLPEKIQ